MTEEQLCTELNVWPDVCCLVGMHGLIDRDTMEILKYRGGLGFPDSFMEMLLELKQEREGA